MFRRTFAVSAAWLLMAVGFLLCCGGVEPPVGDLAIQPSTISLGFAEWSTVQLHWLPSAPLNGLTARPRVFVHLLDSSGALVRTFDHEFPGAWAVGVERKYPLKLYQSALGTPLRAGKYKLTAGLYDLEGRRWPLRVAGEETDNFEYEVATVAIPENPQIPMFYFSSEWKPTVAGGDVQILARRGLGEPAGTIRLTEIPSPGKVWISLVIPQGESALTWELDSESQQPTVVVTNSCGGEEVRIFGSGRHDLELPMALSGGKGECLVEVRAAYRLLDGETTNYLALENMAWVGNST